MVTESILIENARFEMGSLKSCAENQSNQSTCFKDAAIPHIVSLSPFRIDRHEVTNLQFRWCIQKGHCSESAVSGLSDAPGYSTDAEFDNHPVIQVSFKQAIQYCRFVGRRLPTEAEWEFAARGKADRSIIRDLSLWPWGDVPPKLGECQKAILEGCGDGESKLLPKAVESTQEDFSELGVSDMIGNVSEWVFDFYHIYQYCRDGLPIADALANECNNDQTCINTKCFQGSNTSQPKPECAVNCTSKTDPFCLIPARTLIDPARRQPGLAATGSSILEAPTERVFRGGNYRSKPCLSAATARFHHNENEANGGNAAFLGFRCAEDVLEQ